MPNPFAYLVLFAWPVVITWLYSARRPMQATVIALLGAHLLLPVHLEVDLPLIPPFDKHSLPNTAAFVACLIFVKNAKRRLLPRFGLVSMLILFYLTAPFMAAANNGDVTWVGGRFLPPMTPYDALSSDIQIALFNLIPFWLGRAFLNDFQALKYVLKCLAIAGLAYSLLIVFEVRMSPQLHTWFYGYFPHEFIQQMRYGGFRPVVFLGHGLIVGFFAMCATIAATALWRMRTSYTQLPSALVASYLGGVVVLCKAMGSIIYTGFLAGAIAILKPRTQRRIAIAIAFFTLIYPPMRVSGVFPTTQLVEIIRSIDTERSASLQFRFDQEREMIARAQLRPWFGWGIWGRYRTYAKGTGEDTSVTDSRWFITFGQYGYMGFFAEFMLMLSPLWLVRRVFKTGTPAKERIAVAAMVLLVTIAALDSLVNDAFPPLIWMLSGSLVGYAEHHRKLQREMRRLAREMSEDTIGAEESSAVHVRPGVPPKLEHLP